MHKLLDKDGVAKEVHSLQLAVQEVFAKLSNTDDLTVSKATIARSIANINQAAELLNNNWRLINDYGLTDDELREGIVDLFSLLANLKKEFYNSKKYTNN